MWTRLKTWLQRSNFSGANKADEDARKGNNVLSDNERTTCVLFVCMGNICRSPMAEGAFRKCLEDLSEELDVHVDSAGTHSYHVGAPPDRRAQTATARRGIDISMLKARRVEPLDFERFDYILAMDEENLDQLREEADALHHKKLKLLLEFSDRNRFREVPDPYYGGPSGFEKVLDLVEEATEGLARELLRRQRVNRRR